MQPPFWLNAAPRPIPVLPNSCMGGLHLAKRGAAFINFLLYAYKNIHVYMNFGRHPFFLLQVITVL
jgi:hypothetical protein